MFEGIRPYSEGSVMNYFKQKTAVIIDPYSSGSLFFDAFKAEGVNVVAVMSEKQPPDVYASSFRPDDFSDIYISDSDDLEGLAAKLKEYEPICVLAGCESGVELAESLAPLVCPDLSNDRSLAQARRDKGLMSAAVSCAGVPMMRQICTNNLSEVNEWININNFDNDYLVVKPPKSASTDGVKKVNRYGGELHDAFTDLINNPNRLGIINDRVLVQEYLTGVEYVVDTFSYEGRHSICSICKYTKVDTDLGMAIYDRMDWISPKADVVEQLSDYAKAVLNALGMRFGNAHIEIMMTANGPRLIELGARPHGGGNPRLCRIATGDSQLHRSVRYFTSGVTPPDEYILKKNMTVVFLMAKQASIVTSLSLMHDLKKLNSFLEGKINIDEGQYIPATKDLFATLALGYFVLANNDLDTLEEDIQAIRSAEYEVYQPVLEDIA
nr:ATP-grasp domain-containing protein [Pseudomonas luteola]